MVTMFSQAVRTLGPGHTSASRYSLRHGGASDDMITKRRSIPEIKQRGGWSSDSSLKRYVKETRILSELNKVAPQVLHFADFGSSHLEQVFQSPEIFPPLPPVHPTSF